MEQAPLCPNCKINRCSRADEPGQRVSYFSHCYTCTMLTGHRDHSHTRYPSPAQVAAGTYPAGHSWRTSVIVRPLWEGGKHVGYRCVEFDVCGWEERFTAEEMEPCSEHTRYPDDPMIKGVCQRYLEHRTAAGELDGRGYITDYGRQRERERSDAANWDPGQYVERTLR